MGQTSNMRQHLLTVFSLCIICASASTFPFRDQATSGSLTHKALSKVDHHFQIAKETVERVFSQGRREGLAEQCDQISGLSNDQITAQAPQIPAECLIPIIDFYKGTMCSDVCKNSPMMAKITDRRAGSRQLLGGAPDDPTSSCDDPCFSPLMKGMITVMRAMMTPTCQTAFGGSGRRLLGGADGLTEDNMAAMEIGFGLLCSKNAAGSYCMSLFDELGNDDSTGFDDTTCVMSPSEQTQVSALGCCWGNMVVLAGLADEDEDFCNEFSTQATACGITLTTSACASGISITTIKSTVNLDGVTLTQIKETANQQAFKKGVAKTAGVSDKLVSITKMAASARRSGGVSVESSVALTGDAGSTQAAVEAKLQNSATLQSNIQAADSSSTLASATVGSTTAANGYTVEGTVAGNSGSSYGMGVGVIVGILMGVVMTQQE